MPTMDIGLEILFSDDAADEIGLTVDFYYQAGMPAHMGSLTYAGHPADPPEIEIDTIFWPIKRWDTDKKVEIADHT